MKTKKFLALVLALVMAFSLVVPASAETSGEIPDQPGKLTHSTEPHETAKMTVYVTKGEKTLVAAVGAINSHMDATLELNYGTYPVDGTITVYGQTEKKANMTEFTLDGTSSNTGIDFTTNNNGEGYYFPGLGSLTNGTEYYIHFVDAMDATATPTDIGDYTFKKTYTVGDKGITLTATNVTEYDASEVDKNWQDLKDEAFDEDSDNYDDSYISLAAGSYIALNTEKLIAAGTLKLDDFSNSTRVQDNIENAQKQLMLTTGTNLGYQILLKKGTRFKLGNSYADVNTDLLITMEGNEPFNENDKLLDGIYSNLTTAGKANLAKNMLNLFSYIAGSVRNGSQAEPVVITFGTPTTSTSSSTDGTTTVETTVTKNEAGTNDVTTVETTTNTVNSGETTTVTEAVTTTSSTVAKENTSDQSQEKYTVNYTSQKVVTTTTYQDNVQTSQSAEVAQSSSNEVEVVIKEESKNNDVSALSQEDVSVNIADAELNNLTPSAKAALVNEAVTRAQDALQTQEDVERVTVSLAIVATAKNSDAEAETFNAKTYEVKPVVTTTVEYQDSGSTVVSSNTVSNSNLTGNFQIKLPVPSVIAQPGANVKVTHKSEENPGEVFEVFDNLTVAEDRTATVTVTHFSEFVLEPISAGSSSELTYLKSLTLTSEIAVNFYIGGVTNPEGYEVVYYKTVNGQPDEYPVTTDFADLVTKKGSDTKTYYYVELAKFPARQMTDTVTVIVRHNGTQLFANTYSIQGYCNDVIDNSNYTEKHQNVCRAILDYGKYSQLYFNYKTGDLANSANGGDDYFALPWVPNTFACTNSSSDGVIVSLSLKSQVVMNIYVPVTKTIDKVTVPEGLTSTNIGVVESNMGIQYNHIQVTGYVARSLGETVTVTVNNHDYIWSPLGYSYSVQNNSNEKLANVSRAVYNYYFYAVKYFSKANS